ncbi:MAG: iron ABC transporter permease, partial [Pseudomonadota bacterium]
MTAIQSDPPKRRRPLSTTLARVFSWLIVALCALPLVAVTLAAGTGSLETLQGLAQTVLPRYAGTTLFLVVLVGAGTAV